MGWRVLACLVAIGISAVNADAAVMVTQSQALRCGLTRAWFAQVGSLRSTGPVTHLTFGDALLLVQTERGLLTALDAETGRTLWSKQAGKRGLVASEASAGKNHVAVLNGSTLYVLDRATGKIQWQRSVGSAPGAGPECGETHVFVPLAGGMVEAYALDGSTKGAPWLYKSSGRVFSRPMATPQSVSWPTDRGHLYVADPAAKGIRFRLETRDAINARPGYWTPYWFVGSSDGTLYAVDEISGRLDWKVALGEPIHDAPVALNDKVFVVTPFRGMTCIDTKTAKELWSAPGIKQFISASLARAYGSDSSGRLVVLDIQSGIRLGSLPLDSGTKKAINGRSDRLFLVNETGAVQCLHEVELKSPLVYTPPPPPKREPVVKPKERPEAPPDAEPKADSSEEPTEEPPPEGAPAEAPAAEAEPADMPADLQSEDPFGGTP